MFKKTLMILIITTVANFSSYGFGIGIEGGGGWVYDPDNATPWSAALSFGAGDIYDQSSTGAIAFSVFDKGFYLNGHVDWAVSDFTPSDWFQMYVNLGPELGFFILSDELSATNIAVRAGLGMRFIILKHFDIFLELAPSLGISFGTDYQEVVALLYANLHGNLGIRFWI